MKTRLIFYNKKLYLISNIYFNSYFSRAISLFIVLLVHELQIEPRGGLRHSDIKEVGGGGLVIL